MHYEWKVSGLSCGHCVRAITQAIHDLDAQAQVQISLEQATLRVESSLSEMLLAQALEQAGYSVQPLSP
jgi:copper chaperone